MFFFNVSVGVGVSIDDFIIVFSLGIGFGVGRGVGRRDRLHVSVSVSGGNLGLGLGGMCIGGKEDVGSSSMIMIVQNLLFDGDIRVFFRVSKFLNTINVVSPRLNSTNLLRAGKKKRKKTYSFCLRWHFS